MSLAPPTPPSLLLRIRDSSNNQAWAEFVEIYAPLILAYARHHGLSDDDAADLSQEVLSRVARTVKSFDYDPNIGRFSGWLLTVTRNQIRKGVRDAPRDRGSGRTTIFNLLQNTPDESADEELWNRSHRLRLLQWASEKVRDRFEPATWQAFHLTFIEHQSALSVAERLNISVGAVYISRSRVLARIREVIGRVESE